MDNAMRIIALEIFDIVLNEGLVSPESDIAELARNCVRLTRIAGEERGVQRNQIRYCEEMLVEHREQY